MPSYPAHAPSALARRSRAVARETLSQRPCSRLPKPHPRLPGNGRSQPPDLHPLCLARNCQLSEYLAVAFVSVQHNLGDIRGAVGTGVTCAPHAITSTLTTEVLLNRHSAGDGVSDAARAADACHCGRAGDAGRSLTRGHGSLRGCPRVQDCPPAQREQVKVARTLGVPRLPARASRLACCRCPLMKSLPVEQIRKVELAVNLSTP
jgi:hypothetical protein